MKKKYIYIAKMNYLEGGSDIIGCSTSFKKALKMATDDVAKLDRQITVPAEWDEYNGKTLWNNGVDDLTIQRFED